MAPPTETPDLGFGVTDSAEADYEKMKSSVLEEVKRIFKPEFINRIDEIIVFHMLTKDNICEIVKLLLKELGDRAKDQLQIELEFKDSAVEFLSKVGFDKAYGARPVKRAIQTNIEDALAEQIVDENVKVGNTVVVYAEEDKFHFEVK